MRYVSPNAVANINTDLSHLSLSLLFSCVYFSKRRTLPMVLNFCMQTYIDPNRSTKMGGINFVGGGSKKCVDKKSNKFQG